MAQQNSVSNPRVLITGANGFVGRWLREELQKVLPPAAQIVSTFKGGGNDVAAQSQGTEVSIALDIEDEEAVAQVIETWRPTVVIHLAAVSHVLEASASPKQTFAVNLNGTIALACSVRKFCPDALFINIGSSEVYGSSFIGATSPLDEETLLAPTNVYATSKAAADLFIGQMARSGLNSVRFRPFNHTGPGQAESFVVSGFAAQIARIEKGLQPPTIKVGNLEAQRDFTDVRDIVSAYAAAALLPAEVFKKGEILNLSSGIPRRIGDILDELLGMSPAQIQIIEDPTRMRPSEVRYAAGSSVKAHGLLKWSPTTPWQETLRSVLDYWRSKVSL
ncbi:MULTISPECIES: GDP-mannose 4,6-dehydratase [Agrobacterium tumefaciens complex]|uniref:GDP-6-deoxy-D-mannose reductase n=1 Tax=Agrobacterium tomkonis CFBP 6623 TaxID=1183432 RepID=A0A1S7RZ92_9HYPH|nr:MULTISPECIES: GDP-mannose 4,6-dehydratase [Agrobacterium tumefaciens complex]QCL92107.1 NAD-dependent epimerase/dehydratase family protein [Agrobacterium tumefaciens]CUX59943.1 GDP-6-deoxy-D-mannose reductase [Agrobacterium tomkonis CFBP 6623]